MKRDIFHSSSPEETKEFAARFAKTLQSGDVIALQGELGSGKTTFVQGLALGLGVEDYVNSPTFKIVNEFNGEMTLFHFDFYRVNSAEELLKLGFEDYIYQDAICVIEWADRFPEILPEGAIKIYFSNISNGDTRRKIEVEREK